MQTPDDEQSPAPSELTRKQQALEERALAAMAADDILCRFRAQIERIQVEWQQRIERTLSESQQVNVEFRKLITERNILDNKIRIARRRKERFELIHKDSKTKPVALKRIDKAIEQRIYIIRQIVRSKIAVETAREINKRLVA